MSKILKSIKGFTLIELMVVVAIIGILSAVAVPNFKKYQAKAKASEGKVLLSGIYMAEQSFYGDYDTYANCLTTMGFNPGSPQYFTSGFNNTNDTTAKAQIVSAWGTGTDASACKDQAAVNGQTFFNAKKGSGGVTAVGSNLSGTSITANAFIASAVGVVDKDHTVFTGTTSRAATWYINENKDLSNDSKGY